MWRFLTGKPPPDQALSGQPGRWAARVLFKWSAQSCENIYTDIDGANPEELPSYLMPRTFGLLKQGEVSFGLGLSNLVSQTTVCK